MVPERQIANVRPQNAKTSKATAPMPNLQFPTPGFDLLPAVMSSSNISPSTFDAVPHEQASPGKALFDPTWNDPSHRSDRYRRA